MSTDVLRSERRDGALWLTMTRPDKLNSVGPPLIAALGQALDEVALEDRCIVLRAEGRAFSAGGDLSAVDALAAGNGSQGDGAQDDGAQDNGAQDELQSLDAFHRSITDVLRRLELSPIPVVAAVEGLAIAGGLEIAAACDVVAATTQARFGDGHARYGLLPGGGGSVRLPRAIGVNRAKYLMLTGRQVSAQTMYDWGLVTMLTEQQEFEANLNELVADLVRGSRDGLARLKRLVDDGLELPVEQALDAEQRAVGEHARSTDYHEGLAAFRERREPRFA